MIHFRTLSLKNLQYVIFFYVKKQFLTKFIVHIVCYTKTVKSEPPRHHQNSDWSAQMCQSLSSSAYSEFGAGLL